MSETVLASLTFTLDDQRAFADLSGDVNPMHLNAVAARRMQAGVPVVHGINAMLWAIDVLLAADPAVTFDRIDARFERFVAIGEAVTLHGNVAEANVRLEIRSDESRLMRIDLRRAVPLGELPPGPAASDLAVSAAPRQPAFADTAGATGALPLVDPSALYPRATAAMGAARTGALVMLSTLVGMDMPGLHSIFSSVLIDLDDAPRSAGRLDYRVTDAHDLFRLLTIAAEAPGMRAKVKAFMRPPAVVQPSMADLRAVVGVQDHAGVGALVIGGSRGLGEVTAKLLAAGGANVIITYAAGADDAERVAAEIRDAGGRCTTRKLDVLAPLEGQLHDLPRDIGEVYYFATTKIFHQSRVVFSAQRFADFERIYVSAFETLCRQLQATLDRDLTVFYPSSVAVADRPRGMTEYSMAKAAGEILCEDIDRFMPHVRTVTYRLPRLPTDQTSTVTPEETDGPTETMLRVVDLMRAARSA